MEALGGYSALLLTMGGQPNSNQLGESYYSQAPIRYGAYMAKVGLVPLSASFKALTDREIDIAGRENALREEIADVLAHDGGQWELRVQLCRDLTVNPIEDASVAWPEEDNPYVAVAVISVGPNPPGTSHAPPCWTTPHPSAPGTGSSSINRSAPSCGCARRPMRRRRTCAGNSTAAQCMNRHAWICLVEATAPLFERIRHALAAH